MAAAERARAAEHRELPDLQPDSVLGVQHQLHAGLPQAPASVVVVVEVAVDVVVVDVVVVDVVVVGVLVVVVVVVAAAGGVTVRLKVPWAPA